MTGHTDHPRSRGVYRCPVPDSHQYVGSSPLARGLRLILISPGISCTDHPRSRGVYGRIESHATVTEGSSPLARGLPVSDRGHNCPERIIPARAGFTNGVTVSGHTYGDHPRSRGVYHGPRVGHFQTCGSSPLARGLRGNILGAVTQGGIIPARAGFTRPRRGRASRPRDHPRSRGVYLYCASPPLTRKGSSPLARGLHAVGSYVRHLRGIIPARAGFTAGNNSS